MIKLRKINNNKIKQTQHKIINNKREKMTYSGEKKLLIIINKVKKRLHKIQNQ